MASFFQRCPMNILILLVHAAVWMCVISGPPYCAGPWTSSLAIVAGLSNFGNSAARAGPVMKEQSSSVTGIAPIAYMRAVTST